MSRERGSRRLRFAVRAYPRQVREGESEVLVSLAQDMIDDGQSSINREMVGIFRGGLAMRAGWLSEVPWAEALRRVGLPMAVALLAINLGMLAFWAGGIAWPGWSWVVIVGAPAMAVVGLLSGRRLPLILGAALICLLGVAQGNGLLEVGGLEVLVYWPTGGIDGPFLAVAIPVGLVLLAAGLFSPRPASRGTIGSTLAWIVAGAVLVRLLYPRYVTFGDAELNGLGICAAAYGIAVVVAMALGVVRRRRDPAGMVMGIVAVATAAPAVLLYGLSSLPLGDGLQLLLLGVSLPVTVAILLRMVRLTPTEASSQ